MAKHMYLAKANDALVSHCTCDDSIVSYPPQMDCPWCGCGWLFSCIRCRKAFTFAMGIETDVPWDELARRDIQGYGGPEPDVDSIADWVGDMQYFLEDVEPGVEYVCLDGAVIPTDVTELEFTGWHARHELDFLPQVRALDDPTIVDSLLANVDYWESRAVPDED